MTVAIVALFMEASKVINFVAPLSTCAGLWACKLLLSVDYTEELVFCKGVPFSGGSCPTALMASNATAGSLCAPVPPNALLPHIASVELVSRVLATNFSASGSGTHRPLLKYFPVVDRDGRLPFLRLVGRECLESAVARINAGSAEEIWICDDSDEAPSAQEDQIDVYAQSLPVVHFVTKDTPIASIYGVFSRLEDGVEAVCVLDKDGDGPQGLFGILDRDHLAMHGPH